MPNRTANAGDGATGLRSFGGRSVPVADSAQSRQELVHSLARAVDPPIELFDDLDRATKSRLQQVDVDQALIELTNDGIELRRGLRVTKLGHCHLWALVLYEAHLAPPFSSRSVDSVTTAVISPSASRVITTSSGPASVADRRRRPELRRVKLQPRSSCRRGSKARSTWARRSSAVSPVATARSPARESSAVEVVRWLRERATVSLAITPSRAATRSTSRARRSSW